MSASSVSFGIPGGSWDHAGLCYLIQFWVFNLSEFALETVSRLGLDGFQKNLENGLTIHDRQYRVLCFCPSNENSKKSFKLSKFCDPASPEYPSLSVLP